MYQIRAGFMYLCIPRINDAKIEEEEFVLQQITQLMQDKIWRPAKWSGKAAWKSHYQYFWKIIKLKTSFIWWLILYNPTKLWDVICL